MTNPWKRKVKKNPQKKKTKKKKKRGKTAVEPHRTSRQGLGTLYFFGGTGTEGRS